MRHVVLLVGLLLASGVDAARYQGVCREKSASGFQSQHTRALKVFSEIGAEEKVTDFKKTVIYVEAYGWALDTTKNRPEPPGLYFHSNYVTPGHTHPTKIAIATRSMPDALENIFFDKPPATGKQRVDFMAALESDALFIFDIGVAKAVQGQLELGPIDTFGITDGKGSYLLIKRKKTKAAYECEIEDPCWDKAKWEIAETCNEEKTSPVVTLINSVLTGAISGFECSVRRRR